MPENDSNEPRLPDKSEVVEARIDPYITDILLGPVESYVKALQVTDDPEKIRSVCSRLVRLGFISGVMAGVANPESLPEVFEPHQEDHGDQNSSSA